MFLWLSVRLVFFPALNTKTFSNALLPYLCLGICFVFLCSGRGFMSLHGTLNPHRRDLLTNPALFLPPLLFEKTRPGGWHPPHPTSSPPVSVLSLCPRQLQNNEFLADDGVALCPGSEPTPAMLGIWESAFWRLCDIWNLHPTSSSIWKRGKDRELLLSPTMSSSSEGP